MGDHENPSEMSGSLGKIVVFRVVTGGTVLRFREFVALVKPGCMLENPCIRSYSPLVGSDNAPGADNQQGSRSLVG